MLRDVQSSLRARAQRSGRAERIGPFLATFHPSTIPALNYAMPDDGAQPSPSDVAALVAAFRERDRIPRFEYAADLAPAVLPVLLAEGFVPEREIPVLVHRSRPDADATASDRLDVHEARTDADFRGVALVEHEAYGDAEDEPGDGRGLADLVASGGVVVVAFDRETGEPAGSGLCDAPHDGVAEVAGVGVRPAFRRRGVAGAVTAELVRAATAVGIRVLWLTPGHPDAARVYERVGFAPIGHDLLHVSLPETQKELARTADEKDTLLAFLGFQQQALVRTVLGAADAGATTALELLDRATDVLVTWVEACFAGRRPPTVVADRAGASALGRYQQAVDRAAEIVRGATLDDRTRGSRGDDDEPGASTLRWILLQVVEELARLDGRAALLREQFGDQSASTAAPV